VKTRAAAAGLGLLAALATDTARAGLATDAEFVAARFASLGTVIRPRPLLFAGGSPAALTVPLAAVSRGPSGCTTVIVLGAVSTAFTLSLPAGEGEQQFIASVAGLAQVARCGPARMELAELSIVARSPHAILELVVVTSRAPLPDARVALPHRDPGSSSHAGATLGPPPTPGPLARRVLRLEGELQRDDARETEKRVARVDSSGSGRLVLELEPGCHRITVFGMPLDARDTAFHDVDAELDWASGSIAAADKTESPDAALLACTAERELGVLSYAGAAPSGSVLVLRARTPMPQGVPERWGIGAARLARTLLERRIPAPPGPPVFESLGVAGLTVLHIELEPGRCYIAAAAVLEGDVKLLGLSASSEGPASLAHGDDVDSAAVVTFCAGRAIRGALEVEAQGGSPIWIAGLWPVASRRLGEEAP
jgi:hypothetical protein